LKNVRRHSDRQTSVTYTIISAGCKPAVELKKIFLIVFNFLSRTNWLSSFYKNIK